MKIIVLGSTGYLGGNIVKRLVADGHDVYCVVRQTSDLSRICHLPVKYIISSYDQIELTFKTEKIDWIINGVCTYNQNARLYEDMFQANLIFPLTVMNLAMRYGVENFVTIGTGLPDDFNVYSYTKSKLSEMGRFFSQRSEIKFYDLKLEMFYGGDFEPDSRFLRSMIGKLAANETILLTSGTQKRDLIRVEDVLEILSGIISGKIVLEDHYNLLPVGTGENHSIREIIEFLKEQLGSSSELVFGARPDREGGEPDTLADMSWFTGRGLSLKYGYFEGLKSVAELYGKQ